MWATRQWRGREWCITWRATAKAEWQKQRLSRGAAIDGEDGGQSGRTAQGQCLTIQAQLAADRPNSITMCQLDRSMVTIGRAKPSQAVIWNWWRQGMMGGAKAHYDGIVAFSQTDFTEDLKKITSRSW